MNARIPALVLSLACLDAGAAGAPQPQPVAPGALVAAAKANLTPMATVIAAPVAMETTAVVMPDGTIGLDCQQQRQARPLPIGIKQLSVERPR